MKLSTLKENLKKTDHVSFKLPDGSYVPSHFHVTELGIVTKHFIDCGGTIRKEEYISLQLWEANDYNHRIKPEKLMKIIEISEKHLPVLDYEIEIEYQHDTIGKYGVNFDGKDFILTAKHTTCLASDTCGTNNSYPETSVLESNSCCGPGSSCC